MSTEPFDPFAAFDSPAPQAKAETEQILEAAAAQQFDRRWARRLKESNFPRELWQPVMQAEAKRVQRGTTHFTDDEAVAALQATLRDPQALVDSGVPEGYVKSIQPRMPAPDKMLGSQFLGNARQNFVEILKSLPHVPAAIVKEPFKAMAASRGDETVEDLDRSSLKEIIASMGTGKQLNKLHPGEQRLTGIRAMANTPILRLVPGVHTAAAVAAGDTKELYEHPLTALLDVAPFLVPVLKGPGAALLDSVPMPFGDRWLRSTFMRDGMEMSPHQIASLRTWDKARDISLRTGESVTDILARQGAQYKAAPSVLDVLHRSSRFVSEKFGLGGTGGNYVARQMAEESSRYARSLSSELMDTAKMAEEFGDAVYGQKFRTDVKFREELTGLLTRSLEADAEVTAKIINGDTTARYAQVPLPVQRFQKWYDNRIDELTEAGVKRGAYVRLDPRDFDAQFDFLSTRAKMPIRKIVDEQAPWPEEMLNRYDASGKALLDADGKPVRRADIYSVENKTGKKWTLLRGKVKIAEDFLRKNPDKQLSGKMIDDIVQARKELIAQWREEPPPSYLENLRAAVTHKTGISAEAWQRSFDELQRKHPDLDREALTDIMKATHGEYEAAKLQAFGSWVELKKKGMNPSFVHQVSYGKGSAKGQVTALYPTRAPNPSADLLKAFDVTRTYFRDLQVSLDDFTMETLRHTHSANFILTIERLWQRTGSEVHASLVDYWQTKTGLPREQAERWAGEQLQQEWTTWVPDQYYTFRQPRVQKPESLPPVGEAIPEYVIPKRVANMLEQLAPEGRRINIPGAWDKGMNAWRMSVLGLRPQWNVNNVVGGAIMLFAKTGPSVFRYFGKARKATGSLKDVYAGKPLYEGLDAAARDTLSRTRIREDITRLGPVAVEHQQAFLEGRTLARWGTKHGPTMKKWLEAPYAFNEWVDNMYRAMAFMHGKDKALVKGMSKAEAVEQGVRLGNKVLQDWNALTPAEKMIFKQLVPFYGWAKHITRYTMSYAWDHPLRTAFMDNLSSIVVNGNDPYHSERFNLGMFKIGAAHGKIRSFNIGAANPFADAANIMTFRGFLSYLNPAIQGLFASAGIDPRTGAQDAYPDFEFDPATGKVEATRPGLKQSAIDMFPQVGALARAAGLTEEARNLEEENPQAHWALIWSRMGLPFGLQGFAPDEETGKWAPGLRQYDLDEERSKTAAAMNRAEMAALSSLVRENKSELWKRYSKLPIPQVQSFAEQADIAGIDRGQAVMLLRHIEDQRMGQGLL